MNLFAIGVVFVLRPFRFFSFFFGPASNPFLPMLKNKEDSGGNTANKLALLPLVLITKPMLLTCRWLNLQLFM